MDRSRTHGQAWIGLEPMGVVVQRPPAVFSREKMCHPKGKGVFWVGKPVFFGVVASKAGGNVSADKTSVVQADISQDIPQALWTEGRPLRGRPSVQNVGRILGDVC